MSPCRARTKRERREPRERNGRCNCKTDEGVDHQKSRQRDGNACHGDKAAREASAYPEPQGAEVAGEAKQDGASRCLCKASFAQTYCMAEDDDADRMNVALRQPLGDEKLTPAQYRSHGKGAKRDGCSYCSLGSVLPLTHQLVEGVLDA